jgi:hypothetical protein
MRAFYFIETAWKASPPEAGVTFARWYLLADGKRSLLGEAFGPEAYQEALGTCNADLRERGVDASRWSKAVYEERMTARSRSFEIKRYEGGTEIEETLPLFGSEGERRDDEARV